ncbi:HNH endonuclease [Streptomyces sp. MPA0124]|uniref:HNH endonuclease n=1 Tax=Streptomyces sp. MPA0124 TaxID=3378069 RepID=UPI003853646A
MPNATRPTTITCARCGTEKKVGRGGPVPIYCSAACRSILSNERARTDGRREAWNAKARTQAATQRQAAAKPCPYCGEHITNPRRKQCGSPDCKRAFNADRMRTYMRTYRAETGQRYAGQYTPKPRQRTVTCAYCGEEATVTKSSARYCSRDCWYEARRATHARIAPYRPRRNALRIQVIVVRRATRRRWYSACCPACTTWFVTDNPNHRACSTRCGRRLSKDRRRALERNAFVAHVSRPQVYERDQWTCQLCGEAVLRDEVVPHPQAPTLDHIVALSRGGTHEPANVQLAHYYCNTIKNADEWPG